MSSLAIQWVWEDSCYTLIVLYEDWTTVLSVLACDRDEKIAHSDFNNLLSDEGHKCHGWLGTEEEKQQKAWMSFLIYVIASHFPYLAIGNYAQQVFFTSPLCMHVCMRHECMSMYVIWVWRHEFTMSIYINCALSYIWRHQLLLNPKLTDELIQLVSLFEDPLFPTSKSWDFKQAAVFALDLFMWMLEI